MAVLHELIILLDSQQTGQIQKIKLQGRERQTMDFVMGLRHRKKFPSALALQKLQLTETHFYKISSSLTKKILCQLCGDNPLAQFRFIRNMPGWTPALLRHQMHISERQLKGSPGLAAFYQECCDVVSRMCTNDLSTTELNYYTKRLLTLIDRKKEPERFIKIKADHLYAQISVAVLNRDIDNEAKSIVLAKRIEKLVAEAEELNHPSGLYYANNIGSMFFISVNEQEIALKYIHRLLEVTQAHQGLFNSKQLLEPKLMLAECLSYLSRFRQAYDILYPLLYKKDSDTLNFRLASFARFFKVSVTLGEYDTAKSILDFAFAAKLNTDRLDLRIMTLLQYSCYYLHIGKPKNAAHYLSEARTNIHRKKQLTYDLQLRFFENIFLLQHGNYEQARLTADKNLKFLRSKNMGKHKSHFPFLFSSIKAIYDKLVLNKPFNTRQQNEYDYCFTGSFSHFGGALKQAYEMKQVKKRTPVESHAALQSD